MNLARAIFYEFFGACDGGSTRCDDVIDEEDAGSVEGRWAGESVDEVGEPIFGVEADLGFGVTSSAEKVRVDAGFGKRLGEEF